MPETITYGGTLIVTSCWCGIRLGVPRELYDLANRQKNKGIYCPVGHAFVFNNTLEEQLEEQKRETKRARQREDAVRDLLTHEEHSHRATRGHMTRIKKRVAAGVCPCCNRSFKDLARHMAGQHPDYK
jgi:DNA repair exonuclease SbcCD ATPase subunit